VILPEWAGGQLSIQREAAHQLRGTCFRVLRRYHDHHLGRFAGFVLNECGNPMGIFKNMSAVATICLSPPGA